MDEEDPEFPKSKFLLLFLSSKRLLENPLESDFERYDRCFLLLFMLS